MKKFRLLFCVIALSMLAACGLKKNLELPKNPNAPQQAKQQDGNAAPAPASQAFPEPAPTPAAR